MPSSANIHSSASLPPLTHVSDDGLTLRLHTDGLVSVRARGRRLCMSADGQAVSVEHLPPRPKLYSLSRLPARFRPLYDAGQRFLSLMHSCRPRVVVRAGAATACLLETGGFIFTAGKSRCFISQRSPVFSATIEDADSSHIDVSPASAFRLSGERARLFCRSVFMWHECVRAGRVAGGPVRAGGDDLSVSRFVARPGVGWGMRVRGKVLFLLLADFSAVSFGRRGRRRLCVRLAMPDGRQDEVEVSESMPREFKQRLGMLLILLRALTAPGRDPRGARQ